MNQNRPTTRLLPAAVAATLLIAAGCGSDDSASGVDATDVEQALETVVEEVDAAGADLAQTLRDNGLDTVASVVDQIEINDLIDGEDFTFFAPTDEAFTTLDADQTADLLTDPARILDVLRNHTLAETLTAEELSSTDSVETGAGETLEVAVDGDTVRIGEVTVLSADIAVGDGVIHVVDGLLLVP
jgi:uncharacterized surface protein with fasciclin (FAS1) repeats